MTEEFWIIGNKCHPNSHIVPDSYKQGDLYISKASYDQLEQKLAIAHRALSKIVEADKMGYGTDPYPVIAKRALDKIKGESDAI